ncbi:MAG: AmmeMemoRadiSam system protein B [Patescibacteria group bacterium]
MKHSLLASIGIGLAITLGIVWVILLFQGGDEGTVSGVIVSREGVSRVREPAVAGSFYPASKEFLSAQVGELLSGATPSSIDGFIRAMVVPHAGYAFSGATAAFAYKALSANVREFRRDPLTIILIGSGHTVDVDGAAIDSHDEWQTPLGRVSINRRIRDLLVEQDTIFRIDETPHRSEHSLEVQLPFLQKVLSQFTIVPILVNRVNNEEKARISAALAALPGDVVVIASTDLSHYPSYEDAQKVDAQVIEAIVSGETDKYQNTIHQLAQQHIPHLETFSCAQPAVAIAMMAARLLHARRITPLHYSNSGDALLGDKSRVVGYSSIVFSSDSLDDTFSISDQEKLLDLARDSVETYIRTGRMPAVKDYTFPLNQYRGAFVTIKKDGALRGCIGRFEPDMPLFRVVSEMAIAAASKDSRFMPITPEELNDLHYEISVLSPLQSVKDWTEIKIGTHGVRVQQGSQSGVFLPQVATENGWDLGTFLGELCTQKAGLPRDCWKDPSTQLSVFTAQVFGE